MCNFGSDLCVNELVVVAKISSVNVDSDVLDICLNK